MIHFHVDMQDLTQIEAAYPVRRGSAYSAFKKIKEC